MSQKRNRSRNFSERYKHILLDIVKAHMNVIENKKTDNVSNKQRAESWEKVCLSLNAQQDSGIRTAEQLKNAYDCNKTKARKDLSLDKVEMYKTGGGGFQKHLDETGEKVPTMLPTQNASMVCAFDTDADYHGDVATDIVIEELITPEELILENEDENRPTEDGHVIFSPETCQGKRRKKRKHPTSIYDKVEMLTETQVQKQKNQR